MNERVPVTPAQERFKVKLGEWKEKFPDIADDCDWLQKRLGIQINDSFTAWMTDAVYMHIMRTVRKHGVSLEEITAMVRHEPA